MEYELDGGIDGQGRSTLTLRIHASLPLICWRCLERMAVPLEQTSRFVLVAREADLPPVEEEPEDWTALAAAAPIEPRLLVEDELILALPIAPAHGDGECRPPPGAATGADEEQGPFGALAALKRKQD